MLQNEVQPCCRNENSSPLSHYSAPSKVFILGEYAVLAGGSAVVAALGPRFHLRVERITEEDKMEDARGVAAAAAAAAATTALTGTTSTPTFSSTSYSPHSPLGRLIEWSHHFKLPELKFHFEDPYEGRGGLGASSAQFALAYLALSHFADWDRRWEKVWKLYRELNHRDGISPSGADLVSQWRGSVTLFDPEAPHCADLWPLFDWSGLLVFSATARQPERKVPTHDHLAKLSEGAANPLKGAPWVQELKHEVKGGVEAIRGGNAENLGRALQNVADILWEAGLEARATHEDRLALAGLPGVLGVKGVGAMQADAVLVLHRGSAAERRLVIQKAEDRGLQLLSEGLPAEVGVRAHET